MTNDEELFDREDNIDDSNLENENGESLNAAYDRVSGNGAMPSLEDFLGPDYSDPDRDPYKSDDGIGSVIGDPSFSDDPLDDTLDDATAQPDSGAGDVDSQNSRFNPKSIIDGSYFFSEGFSKKIPFIIFLIIMSILYIANRNLAESHIRKNINLKREVRDLRAESITIAGQLMNISKETEVSYKVEKKKIGVHEQSVPPMYFIIDRFEREDSLLKDVIEAPKRDYINDFNDFEDEYKTMN